MDKIRIFIVDDHDIVRDGIKALLMLADDIIVNGDATDGVNLFEILKTNSPDVLLLDISLPEMSGIEIAQKLKIQYPQIKIIILTAEPSEKNIFDSIEVGVKGFLPKNVGKDKLIDAIRSVYEGEEYFDNSVSQIVLKSYIQRSGNIKNNEETTKLTERETDIIKHITKGFTHKEIAVKLFISKRTVDSHVRNIFEKFQFKSKADIIKYAIKNGIVEL
ncbi:MAG: response regulator transcription factor [Bacteroidales bacterium]|nr:response regulator transcription factor [Bacteroidales bacterium]